MAGRFISFEGIDGTGKTTQLNRLAATLEERGVSCLKTREPGGTPHAEKLRGILLQGSAGRLSVQTEALLFAAARLDHIAHAIEPALAKGHFVLCDRFADSTLAYQGATNGIGRRGLENLQRITLNKTLPDLTLILDLPPDKALARIKAARERSGLDRYEGASLDVLAARRDIFLEIAFNESWRCVVVDASQDLDILQDNIFSLVASRFPEVAAAGVS